MGFLKHRQQHGLPLVTQDNIGWYRIATCGDEVEAVFLDRTHGTFYRLTAEEAEKLTFRNPTKAP